jgi:hypothetical protein
VKDLKAPLMTELLSVMSYSRPVMIFFVHIFSFNDNLRNIMHCQGMGEFFTLTLYLPLILMIGRAL